MVKSIPNLTTFTMILALFVVMLGAYTRLTDAGLGCPDWPFCYGQIVLPKEQKALQLAQNHYPQIPIESRKAWTEMAHRYAAGLLAFCIFFIASTILWQRKQRKIQLPWLLPSILVFLVLVQAILGMWTVTLKLLPLVVMGHLLGGILIFSCLSRLRLELSTQVTSYLPQWHFWIGLGALIVLLQIALGGWVSANYAGIACIGFPQCNGQWLPQLHFSQGFNLLSPVGENYQGGLLDNNIRMTIHLIHRLGALITLVYISLLMLLCLRKIKLSNIRFFALLALIFLTIQLILGIINVVYLLPLWAAVAHNGIAALLFATLLMMLYLTKGGFSDNKN